MKIVTIGGVRPQFITAANTERILEAIKPAAPRGNSFGGGKAAEKIVKHLINKRTDG